MKSGDVCKVTNLDDIDFGDYDFDLEVLVGAEVQFTGHHVTKDLYDRFDDDGDPINDRAYEFIFSGEDGDVLIYLFADNFTSPMKRREKKKPPTNEIEWLDAVQYNFKG